MSLFQETSELKNWIIRCLLIIMEVVSSSKNKQLGFHDI